jgi:endoglucanase
VLIEPKSARWDVRGYEPVLMDVYNPQDAPVRVLLSVNNPGADGTRNCNTEATAVPAGGKATLSLPFGNWHGEPGHPLDQANVVSLRVFLDRPGRAHHFFVDNIRAAQYDAKAMEKVYADEYFKAMKPAFGRGINLGNALEAPNEGDWGVTLEESHFAAIAAAGFESVRIPVRWSAHAEAAAPYRIEPKFFERVDWAVRQSLKHKLIPIVNMHHYDEIMKRPAEHRERFLALWRQIAEHYQDYPAELALELLNEPQSDLTAGRWNELLLETISVIRRTNPKRLLVVGPANFNGIEQLPYLKLPADDQHLVVTVHYYRPFKFTHQGAPWLGEQSRQWLGTTWTGERDQQQAVIRDLDAAIRWAVEHRRPLHLGEFGAYEKADLESRARWTKFIADEARNRKMGYAYWEFCSGFGAYDAKQRQWINPLREALLPAK